MSASTERDFASLLEDLLVAVDSGAAPARPNIPFDYLTVAEELHSGMIHVSPDAAAAEYADMAADFEPGFAAVVELDSELPPLDPDAIALELGLASAQARDLGPLRRRFALENHPDRVAPHLRGHALKRMQIANMLIDEAECRLV